MPVDTLKTTLQVEGPKGMKLLGAKLASQGPLVMWHGSLAAASATAVGHFPWFYTFNLLQAGGAHCVNHRRRIKIEEKAKIVAAAPGWTYLIQFLDHTICSYIAPG